ncbi:hypothetical protein JCM6882_000623 [Rhodosporidiobolus microsporus]
MGLLPSNVDASLVPPLLLVSLPVIYISYRLFTSLAGGGKSKSYNPQTGLGRGAPGFQTGVKRVAIPPALAARIRAGEEVSAEEVTAALEAEKERMSREEAEEEKQKKKLPDGVDEEWLPAGALGGGKSKAKKRK